MYINDLVVFLSSFGRTPLQIKSTILLPSIISIIFALENFLFLVAYIELFLDILVGQLS